MSNRCTYCPVRNCDRDLTVYECIEALQEYATRSKGEWTVEENSNIWGRGYTLTCSECGDCVTVTESALPYERYCRACGSRNVKRWKGEDDD